MRRAGALPWMLLWLAAAGCPREDVPPERSAARAEDPAPEDAAFAAPVGVPAGEASARDEYVGVIAAGEKTDVGPAVAGEVVEVHVRPGDYVEAGDPLATLDARRAREDLRMTEATLRSEKAALGQAQVDREQAASQLAQLERQLADTELRAPFSGTVAERYVDPGGMAGPGSPVVRLISSDALWVRFAVPPHELDRLSVGTIVVSRIEDPAITVEATVRQIAPETDPASQLVFVDAELDLDEALRSRIQAGAAAWVRHMATDSAPGSGDASPPPAPTSAIRQGRLP